jgi:hypothetical protein
LKKFIKDDRDWFRTRYEQSFETVLETLGDEDQTSPITRFEFQIRTNVLKEFKVNHFEEFWGKRQGIYSYLTKKWIECKIDNSKNESKRSYIC